LVIFLIQKIDILFIYKLINIIIINNKMVYTQEIISVLKQIHPNNRISSESIEILQKLFSKFDKLNHTEILELIPQESQLYIHALNESNKRNDSKDKIINIIEYLLAEILKLSGNSARDNKKIIITANNVWLAIFNDDELKELFLDKMLSISPFHHIKQEIYDIYGSSCMVRLNKIKSILDINDIIYEPVIIKYIRYILFYFTNLCSSKELKNKIKSINPNETNISFQQYHLMILEKMINKMKLLNNKINITRLNDIFEDLFPHIKIDINY
jgi:hypothetical protein